MPILVKTYRVNVETYLTDYGRGLYTNVLEDGDELCETRIPLKLKCYHYL